MPDVDTSAWSWWWSTDQERYRGPCSSRQDALMEAWNDDVLSVHVMQANQGAYHADLYDAEALAEQFDEINYELGDGDGDPPSAGIPADVWKRLAATIHTQVRQAVMAHCSTAWAFNGQTAGEWVDLSAPVLAALPAEARQIIADLSAGYAREHGFAPSYVTAEMERLKVVLAPREKADEAPADA